MLPITFSLKQNYPNPFNPSTTIEFDIPKISNVKLAVFNIKGEKINVLIDQKLSAGNYRLHWNGCDIEGYSLTSGLYFYRLKTNNFVATKKLILVR